MCGIVGFWDQAQTQKLEEVQRTMGRLAGAIAHRGPDDQGIWIDQQAGIALGHRRLAILDLSPLGRQPMASATGRYLLVFNGEIYNFRELRHHLEPLGYRFRSHSDTEVMLASFCHWGVEQAVQRFRGMFAFALWDRQERVLTLGRDRIGEKPLYYGWIGQQFVFSSELKALRQLPDWSGVINRRVLTLFLRLGYVPDPYSIYEGINKLPPGTLLTLQHPTPGTLPSPVAYWSASKMAERGQAEPFSGSAAMAIAHLDQLLRQAVGLQMVADVPLGAFLSGGIDSSTVVALMQAQSCQPVKTFTIGFCEAHYNEAEAAQAIARHLQTDHTELYVTPAQAQAIIPQLPQLYDEPFADASQIPTALVAQLARQSVTVSLSGDAGDELFAGYNRYLWGRRWRQVSWLPHALRQRLADLLTAASPQTWNHRFARWQSWLPQGWALANPGNQLHKLARVITAPTPQVLYQQLVSHWPEPAALVLGAPEPPTLLSDGQQWVALTDFSEEMMLLDLMTYLPGDILTKVDRATMGVGLEARIPFLDPLVVEFAWSLPLSLKIRRGQSKWLLRQVLDQYVPPHLLARPKMGFGVPLDHWLRGPLRDWAETLLSPTCLEQTGGLQSQPIRQRWQEHLRGDRNWQDSLWTVLMLQAWLEAEKKLQRSDEKAIALVSELWLKPQLA